MATTAIGLLRHNRVLSRLSVKPTFQPNRQLKSALKIKWVRPEKISCVTREASGDLEPLGTLDMTQCPTPYKDSEELQSANDLVKRIFSLEFSRGGTIKDEHIIKYVNRVKSHRLDDDSPEVQLARMTAQIRNLQIHVDKFPRDKINKVRLKEKIDKRNKWMSLLRAMDYKKFEWLLDRLDFEFKVYGFKEQDRVERKKSLRRLTMIYIEKLKAERLAEYKNFLESQQESFLREKLETLLWMKNTEEECGVTLTVTDDDIDSARKQLQDIQAKKVLAIEEEN